MSRIPVKHTLRGSVPLVLAEPVPEHKVQQVMATLGLDYMQARAHVRQVQWLRDNLTRKRFG